MHDDRASRRHRGELYAALAAIGYGSSYVATAFALHGFGPIPAAFWRSVLAAVLLGVLIAARGRGATIVPDGQRPAVPAVARGARLVLLSLLAGPLFLASLNLAVSHVGATISAFVAGLYAVLSAVIAPAVLPERLSARVLTGLVLALAGTALLAELDPGRSDVIGIAWGLAAAVLFALFLVLARRWSAPYRLEAMTVGLATTTISAAVLGAFVLLSQPATLLPPGIPVDAIVATAWLAGTAAFGQVLTVASVRLIPAARSASFLLLNPVTATILAAVLLGERPSTVQVAGGLLVLLGMAAATVPVRLLARRTAGAG
jgi:drug/metabolite transporter (DMT)-like permease